MHENERVILLQVLLFLIHGPFLAIGYVFFVFFPFFSATDTCRLCESKFELKKANPGTQRASIFMQRQISKKQ